ncbi:unnamed protein product [Ranitomeya imitator]|uniref:Transposase n=1 Tax=Ranitomeya imitator TaxID=111125 RepID=A0ABN9M8H0_9NEOB|nr:unnamed protein product [Ranitomeya imitator]
MNAAKYRDILDENLFQSALDLRLGGRFTFQQDNGPKHTAKITKEWLQNNTVTILKDGNKGKHRVTKRGPALSYPMFYPGYRHRWSLESGLCDSSPATKQRRSDPDRCRYRCKQSLSVTVKTGSQCPVPSLEIGLTFLMTLSYSHFEDAIPPSVSFVTMDENS